MARRMPPRMRPSRRSGVLTLAVLMSAILALPPATRASEQQVGVIAMLLGIATVTRGAVPAPAPLKFKADVLLRDPITTGARPAAQLPPGGTATVPACDRPILTITELPAT